MISTCDLMHKLRACTCLEEVSSFREEYYEDLEPEQHALVFARSSYFLSLQDLEDGITDDDLVDVFVENQQPPLPLATQHQQGLPHDAATPWQPNFDDGISDDHLMEMDINTNKPCDATSVPGPSNRQPAATAVAGPSRHSASAVAGPSRQPPAVAGPSRQPRAVAGPSRQPPSVAGPSHSQPRASAVAGPSRQPPAVAGPSRQPRAVAGPSRQPPSVAGPSHSQPRAAAVAGPSSFHVGGSKKRVVDAPPAREPNLPTHHVTKVSQKHVRKYNANVTDYTVSFQPIENNGPMIEMMPRVNEMFENIIEEMVEGVNDRDFVRIVFNSPQLDRPISMPFVRRDQMNHEAFATKLENTIQSNDKVSLDETVSFNILHMAMPNGGGSNVKCLTIEETLSRKRCIIRMKNKDNMCCPRAIVTGIARIEKHPNFESIKRGYKQQREYAIELYKQAKLPENTKCGIEEIKLFEKTEFMAGFRVVVVSKEHLNFITYAGPEDRQHTIYLYVHDNHFDLITSMAAFYNKSYFCHECLVGYDKKLRHDCIFRCKLCKGDDCPASNDPDSYKCIST
ncbi:uncharacterized protein LOC105442037 isoform X1 [Strongylocentrotus purpuratus]|uniref:Uncharacterized protein n=1 Tax=Strongylocentrotus purpuratus TaxID=7668 RepID=A0A7M7NTI6_STRPU|nr:uncharacterized protein LOC105442037 isoform X1 [Strongylocentrotus purpuratus]